MTAADFPVLWPVTTRWADNDMYGHLNNAVYYQLFDTAINGWIIGATGIDPVSAPAQGVVVESGCKYFRSVEFPHALTVGIRVARLGNSSVTYDLGLFDAEGDDATIAARGSWVHVYVDTDSRRPVGIPESIRELLTTAQTGDPS
ncbi:thioesterase family protein [Williamsia sp.]|uniref:acyl-CoA thioesterase n=1 Tax=Williamsia sp. TaxID=1872085 RepID=UPI001A32A8B7|nr:thioesterase family protein [Williamsia sp.]MBJ7288965.1 acyl-CoA thioesterase [Williamsia sp.]MBJ7291051.1 acyl-CoA thioesterase [Williamsia sp.]